MNNFESLASTVLQKLREIGQTETIVGKPIVAGDATLIPVSKLSIGFGVGSNGGKLELSGSGGGVSVEPIAFVVIRDGSVRVMPLSHHKDVLTKVVDLIPDALSMLKKDSEK